MIIKDAYNILNIDPTTDRKVIKKAYAKQCAIYHPEEYPEEFKKIQQAYKNILDYVNSIYKDNKDDMTFHNNIDTAFDKFKSKEIIMDVEFDYVEKNNNQYQFGINLDSLDEEIEKKDNHNLSLDINLDSLDEESRKKDKNNLSLDIDLELINEEIKKKDINTKGFDENQYLYEKEYINYTLNKIDNQLKINPSVETLSYVFRDNRVIKYLESNEFKSIFQDVLLKYEDLYSDAALEYIQVQAKAYKLTKLIKKGRSTHKKKEKTIFVLIIFLFFVVMMVLNISNTKKRENKMLNEDYGKIKIDIPEQDTISIDEN